MFEIVNGVVSISVRNLVEFVYRSGDIDNRISNAPDTKAMQAGARIHKKIQKSIGSSYRSEVSMVYERQYEEYTIKLEGRADGVITTADTVTIDEIKTMYADISRMISPIDVHDAQAKCYAYIYCHDNNIKTIDIQLTYVNIDSEDVRRFTATYTYEMLEEWFESTLSKFNFWIEHMLSWEKCRNYSISNIEFPFEYREGQKDLCVYGYRTIARDKVMFVQAPTGVGKTISTIFPALKAMGMGFSNKIFYLTAKNITRAVAEDTYDILRKQNLRIKTIQLIAKEKICPYDCQCNPIKCPYAKGHFDRVNDGVADIIQHEDRIVKETILDYAKKHMVCPFEYALDISYWCDSIICDYNYVFDPNAYLRRYFGEGIKGKYTFLIDEAHNLVDRARNMYSATIYKDDVMDFKKLVRLYDRKLYNLSEKLNKQLLAIRRCIEGDFYIVENVGALVFTMDELYTEILRFLEYNKEFPEKELMLEFFFKIRDFININTISDKGYVNYGAIDDNLGMYVRQFCVDPSDNINLSLNKGQASILFSATLLPVDYYMKLLRGGMEDYVVYAKSPFNPENRKILIGDDITTKYQYRNENQYKKVAQYIEKTVKAYVGNYMVFFPSYRYMENVCAMIDNHDFDVLLQKNNFTEEEKQAFIDSFSINHADKSHVGMCVMGGVFSEGIDLKEESLIGAIIVGTGIPQIGIERRIIMDWFSKENKGYEYAYLYPGLNKVLQSGGRVIRTQKDKGIIVLLDDRFLSGQYEGLFPTEWSNMQVVNINNISNNIKKFWDI